MLAKSLICLCIAPLSVVFAGYLGSNSAVDRSVDGLHYPLNGQYPVQDSSDYHHPHHHHPHHPGEVNGTIYEFLSKNPKFTLVTKALNFEGEIAELLKDSKAKLTFFAPPDAVLRHRHGHHHPHRLQWSTIDNLWDGTRINQLDILENTDLATAIDFLDNVEDPEDPGDPEKRKKIIKFILHVVLSYHLIDARYDIQTLSDFNTVPSHIKCPYFFDHQPIRIRVEKVLIPPVTVLNLFSKIVHGVSTTNGFVHVVTKPLIPPPSVFGGLFLVPEFFSTFTSALQRSKLTDLLDLHKDHKKDIEGSAVVTVFAPTNLAFERLPRRLKLFLFSPFGGKVLEKLLRYHIVPDLVFFSDYIHPEDEEKPEATNLEERGSEGPRRWIFSLDWPLRRKRPIFEPISRDKYSLKTALPGHSLDVVIDKKRITLPLPHKPSAIETKLIVQNQLIHHRDLVALNGAIHPVHSLLDPRKPHRLPPDHEGDDENDLWEDWEEWLPQWAEEY